MFTSPAQQSTPASCQEAISYRPDAETAYIEFFQGMCDEEETFSPRSVLSGSTLIKEHGHLNMSRSSVRVSSGDACMAVFGQEIVGVWSARGENKSEVLPFRCLRHSVA